MGRRVRGSGQIKELASGKWQARLPQPGGKVRARTFGTKRSASDWLAEMRGVRTSSKMTFEAFAKRWLAVKKARVAAGTLGVATYGTYERALNNHLIGRLGKFDLAEIEPRHIEHALDVAPVDEFTLIYIRAQKAQGEKAYRPPGRASVQKWRSILYNIFALAARDRLVLTNPVALADRHHGTSTESKQRGLTVKEFAALLQAARGTPAEGFIVLGLATGARPSEMLALRYSDLDFEKNTVRFTASLGRLKIGGPVVRKAMKTARSARTIPVPAKALDPFRHGGKAEAYVFATSTGAPVNIRTFAQRTFAPVAKAAALPNLTMYSLRHAHLTALMRSGTSNVVAAARLGHSSTKLFESVYAHAESDLQREASDRLGELF